MSRLRMVIQRLFRPRKYWEGRAKALRAQGGWFVGRTDFYSYLPSDMRYVHYAYPPNNDGKRVQFRGTPVTALRRAVLYAERANKALKGADKRGMKRSTVNK